jgi:capsular exopolysaccharide synthesis family protein
MKNNNRKKETMERYRLLCNVIENYKKGDAKCISITSNNDTEGKTMIARNLAMLLAKQGKKTLFIDCNLNAKTKVKKFQASKKNGLIAMLELIDKEKVERIKGTSIYDTQLINYVIDSQCENLSTLSLGVNDLEKYSFLFNTENLRTAMERLKKYYDYLIVDAPSFINLSYTQIVSAATDGCLFVLKKGVHEISQGNEIKDKIATIECKVLGCIFNKSNDRNKMFGDVNKGFINVEYKFRKGRAKINQKVNEGV